MKKVLGLVLASVMLFSLVGCGSSGNGDTSKEDDTFKVGLLVPGSVNDQGWCASAYSGLKLIESDLGAEISYVEAGNPTDMKNSYRDYADKGFDLVIGHGFEYSDAASEIAGEYPDSTFVSIGGNKTGDNYAPSIIDLEEVTYLAGVMSAKMTKSKTIGFIGATEIPAVSKTFRGFELGAKSVDPSIEFIYTYVGTYDDVNAGYEAALNQINSGADIIFVNANAVGIGAYKATNEKQVMSWGCITDQSELSPDYMIGSTMAYVDKLYLATAKIVKEGKFTGNEPIFSGIEEGVVELNLNPKFQGEISDEILDLVEKTKQDILDGKIEVPNELEQ